MCGAGVLVCEVFCIGHSPKSTSLENMSQTTFTPGFYITNLTNDLGKSSILLGNNVEDILTYTNSGFFFFYKASCIEAKHFSVLVSKSIHMMFLLSCSIFFIQIEISCMHNHRPLARLIQVGISSPNPQHIQGHPSAS